MVYNYKSIGKIEAVHDQSISRLHSKAEEAVSGGNQWLT